MLAYPVCPGKKAIKQMCCSKVEHWKFNLALVTLQQSCYIAHTHTHTTVLLLFWNMSGTTYVSRYQKGKTNLDLLEQEIVSGSGICWAICKSAPHPRQPCQHPTTQFFTGRMPFLSPNQQHQSTEGELCYIASIQNNIMCILLFWVCVHLAVISWWLMWIDWQVSRISSAFCSHEFIWRWNSNGHGWWCK